MWTLPRPISPAGVRLREGDAIGFVGDTGSPELVHLHLETRRVRDGIDAAKLRTIGPRGRRQQRRLRPPERHSPYASVASWPPSWLAWELARTSHTLPERSFPPLDTG